MRNLFIYLFVYLFLFIYDVSTSDYVASNDI